MGSILPENGPKMSNEALFDIDQLQECMVPKSSLLDDDWLVMELNLSVRRANEIQEITQGTNVQLGLWLHVSNLG